MKIPKLCLLEISPTIFEKRMLLIILKDVERSKILQLDITEILVKVKDMLLSSIIPDLMLKMLLIDLIIIH